MPDRVAKKPGVGSGRNQPARYRIGAHVKARQAAFLEHFANVGIVTTAAKLAQTDRTEHYTWMERDPTYPARFAEAEQKACDRLRTEIFRRAVTGWEEPVFGKLKGKYEGTGVVGSIRKFSDNLLTLAAKARMPEYRERADVVVNNQLVHVGRVEFAIVQPSPAHLADRISGSLPAAADTE